MADNYLPRRGPVRGRLDEIETDIFKDRFDRLVIERLYALKRHLLELRNAALPLAEISSELMRLHEDLIPKELRAYFRDIQDHVSRLVGLIDGMRGMLTTAMQVNLALVANNQNEVVKRLAGWGAILAIPTVDLQPIRHELPMDARVEVEGRVSPGRGRDRGWVASLSIVDCVGPDGSSHRWGATRESRDRYCPMTNLFLETNFRPMAELRFQFRDGGVMFPTPRRRLAKNRDVNVQPSRPSAAITSSSVACFNSPESIGNRADRGIGLSSP